MVSNAVRNCPPHLSLARDTGFDRPVVTGPEPLDALFPQCSIIKLSHNLGPWGGIWKWAKLLFDTAWKLNAVSQLRAPRMTQRCDRSRMPLSIGFGLPTSWREERVGQS
jgi:hypothetical protein